MLKRLSNALRWVKALDLSAAGKFGAAREQLKRIDPERPGVRRLEYYLLNSFVLMRLNDPAAKRAIADSLSAIDRSSKINRSERAYLKKYAQYVLACIYYSQHHVDYSDIDLTNVPQRTMDLFPLRHHPDWRE